MKTNEAHFNSLIVGGELLFYYLLLLNNDNSTFIWPSSVYKRKQGVQRNENRRGNFFVLLFTTFCNFYYFYYCYYI